jgi:hypothetical protein
LLGSVHGILSRERVAHAVIGATALAAHGVSRATADLDLLVVDERCLDDRFWSELATSGVQVQVRRGDATDPLAGVVRIFRSGEPALDLVVGRGGWQAQVLERARPMQIGADAAPVASAPDLVLLKLYAGGPQDLWDVHQLLDANPSLVSQVEASPALRELAAPWRRVLDERSQR